MIITVTMNPAVDKTAEVESLLPRELNRLKNVIYDAGGKGVNVSKVINALGGKSTATGFLGGGGGKDILLALMAEGIQTDFISISRNTRTNLKVVDSEGRLTELNEPGPEVSAEEFDALKAKLLALAAPDSFFVFSGSLPKGIEASAYGKLIEMVKTRGAFCVLDADGAAFKLSLASGPDLIKPNTHELLEYFGKSGELSLEELALLCKEFFKQGVKIVILSMGAEGALFVKEDKVLHAQGLKVKAHSTVGAGDSMVAAFVFALDQGKTFEEAAALSMAVSAGAVTTIGTKPPDKETVEKLLAQVKLKTL